MRETHFVVVVWSFKEGDHTLQFLPWLVELILTRREKKSNAQQSCLI